MRRRRMRGRLCGSWRKSSNQVGDELRSMIPDFHGRTQTANSSCRSNGVRANRMGDVDYQTYSGEITMRLVLTAIGLLGLVAWAGAGEKEAAPVKPKEVRKIYSDGKHNAFTAMVRFNGKLYVAFRHGGGHNSGQADILVLQSSDGNDWKESL